MKKFALILSLLISALTIGSQPLSANGAVIIFKPIHFSDFFIQPAIHDTQFNTSNLYNVFESSADDLYVARLDPFLYRWVQYYIDQGDDVLLPFSGYGEVTFHYYKSIRAIMGITANDEIIILLPELQVSSTYKFKQD